jgi:hypothetical protein
LGIRAPVVVWSVAALLSLGLRLVIAGGLMPADVVITDAHIYTAADPGGLDRDSRRAKRLGGAPGRQLLRIAFPSLSHPQAGGAIEEDHAEDIRNTDVLETRFMGRRVYVGHFAIRMRREA